MNAITINGPMALANTRSAALTSLAKDIKSARALIAGTDDPAKLAEYADKASLAPLLIAGTALPEAVASAREEALDLGMADGEVLAEVALAAIWLEKAEQLRSARNGVNRIERAARAAIDAATDPVVIDVAVEQARQDLAALGEAA